MVSMKEISIACGVSIATVSKALNDHDDIGRETKERIRQKAKEMGYFPNSAAKALKTNRTHNLGVLFVDESNNGLTHDYFAKVLDSFKKKADESGYDITFINAYNSNGLSYLEHCRYRGFDGVIVACINFHAPEVLELIESDIPLITIDHLFNSRCAVISDNAKGMSDLVRYIHSMGHTKIAYIRGDDSAVTRNREVAFYRTCAELGIEVPEQYVRSAKYRNTEYTYKETEFLLDLENPPTCILYPDDFASFGGLNAINQRGLKIPDDISVAGYDGISIASHIEPTLTTIRQDAETVGRVAAEKLISLIEEPKTAMIEQIIVEGILEPGRSVARLS